MDDQLLISPVTQTAVESFAKQPPQTLMIIGLPGSGKTALAELMAGTVLGTTQVANHPYFLRLSRPEGKKDIPIDDVRQTLRSLRLKAPGQGLRRIVFIQDAHYLSQEAQNALLKALEEPADDTAYILSVTSTRSVLPTIASRSQSLNVQPVSLTQAQQFYNGKFPESNIQSAWQLSQGRPGLLNALLVNAAEHPLKQAVDDAKRFLGQDRYSRLLELDKLSKDKEQFNLFMDALAKVLAALQRSNALKTSRQAGLLRSRRLIGELQEALAANTSARLVALELALKLEV